MDRHTAVGAAVQRCRASSLARTRKKRETGRKRKQPYCPKIIYLDQSVDVSNTFIISTAASSNPIKTLSPFLNPHFLSGPSFFSLLRFTYSTSLSLLLSSSPVLGQGPAQHISKISCSDSSFSPNPAIMKSYAIVVSCGFGRYSMNQTLEGPGGAEEEWEKPLL